ncbi:hypothetical protein AX16_001695 [Volvariella volvacea WC 439]|nr:hypothetical protein AX16_001695 [Volvariella volvacea WC 439]
MKLQALFALLTLLGATNALNSDQRKAHHNHAKRQGTSSESSSHSTASPTGTPPGQVPPPVANTPPAGIQTLTSGKPPSPTMPVTATYAPGATPPISGAPVLPTPFVFQMSEWPAQDKIPDVNSPEVQNWMRELEGFDIPDIPPTADGSCAGDPAAAADAANRGWWTCGGHTRDTDITACPDKLTWGVSFDDGPSPYSITLLNYLTEADIKATFFVVGSRVIERPQVLLEQYMTGHEISVHTWSHKHLTSLTTEEVVAELGWTRKAIRDVLGVTPTTMRPPFGDIDDRVRAIALAMGMVPIIWTRTPNAGQFDTNDWMVAGGMVTGEQSYNTFETILSNATILDTGFIVLQHDLYEITVDLATGFTLPLAQNYNPRLTLEPIGQCMKIPTSNLYFESNTNATFPYPNTSNGGYDIDGDGVIERISGNSALSHTPLLSVLSLLSAIVMGAILF